MAEKPKLQIEFVNGPLDGVVELWPGEIKSVIFVESIHKGHYQLFVRDSERLEEGQIRVLELDRAELEQRYRYFWIPER